jgi:hypothetical protein
MIICDRCKNLDSKQVVTISPENSWTFTLIKLNTYTIKFSLSKEYESYEYNPKEPIHLCEECAFKEIASYMHGVINQPINIINDELKGKI